MSYASNLFGTFYSLNKVNKDSPIVFVHGVGLSHKIWKPQINFFREYNTLTYDLLGHGKTPLNKPKVTFSDFSRQLLNLINELKFKKIHLAILLLLALPLQLLSHSYRFVQHLSTLYQSSTSSLILLQLF